MATEIIAPTTIDREELDTFCDELPEPIIAKPRVKKVRGGLKLYLEYPGAFINVVEGGKPCVFPTYDMVVHELCEVENVDISSLLPKTAYFQYTQQYGLK